MALNNTALALLGTFLLSTVAFAQIANARTVQTSAETGLASVESSGGAAPVRDFAVVADECFQFADDRSELAAAEMPDYDGDSLGGAIGAGLSMGIERKRLRKLIYRSCMEGNGYPKAKLLKSKPKP